MDRKGKQKISFICLILAVIIMFVMIFSCKAVYEKNLLEDQKKEISVIYPELSEPLLENIGYYADERMQMEYLVVSVFLLLTVAAFMGTYFILTSAEERRLKNSENELNDIYEQQLSDLKERLAQEENSTKALITDISHQLKTPLASIKMSHELSLTADFSEEERQSFVETETREILRMEALLDELVKLSRLENSMIQIQCEKCSIKKTISEAVSQISGVSKWKSGFYSGKRFSNLWIFTGYRNKQGTEFLYSAGFKSIFE